MGWRINDTASAWATQPDGTKRLKITLKGSGTFSPWQPEDVTGGGEYEIANVGGDVVENGEYEVTALLSYQQSPGANPVTPGTVLPLLTNAVELRAGLAVLRVIFSDSKLGTLTVSCNRSPQTPEMFEGMVVSKGFVMFATPELGPTLFALLSN